MYGWKSARNVKNKGRLINMTTIKKRIENELFSLEFNIGSYSHSKIFVPLKDKLITSKDIEKMQKEYEIFLGEATKKTVKKIQERL